MFDFLKLIDRRKAIAIFSLGLISGVISFLFLAFINFMIGIILSKKNSSDINYVILFSFLMLFFIWSKRSLAFIVIKFSQHMFWKLRCQILLMILKANFYQFSKRKDQIQASLVRDVDVLTNFSLSIIQFLSSFIIAVGCFIYIGIQSKALFLITIGVSLVGVIVYLIAVKFNEKKLETVRELENDFMKNFMDILTGFKEIHLNPKIGTEIYNRKILKVAGDAYQNNIKAFTGFLNMQIIGELVFNSLIMFIIIYGSTLINVSHTLLISCIFVLLYLLGSLNTLMQIIPSLAQVKVASGRITKLKSELNNERFEIHDLKREISKEEFENLKVTNLSFAYKNESQNVKNEIGYHIGPLDLSIKKGETVFVYGGNGSGKTTLINVLLGILEFNSGAINYNGIELTSDNYGDYRTLFSVVFSDFHLFEELYGFDYIPESQIKEYLEIFELNEKVSFKNKAFSSSSLSAGQRKRLGLIIALVRNRPVLVLDEWAADQDPVFRKKFYIEIIPELKKRGFSIIAITHDDSYYNVADKLYKMESGQLTLKSQTNILRKEIV